VEIAQHVEELGNQGSGIFLYVANACLQISRDQIGHPPLASTPQRRTYENRCNPDAGLDGLENGVAQHGSVEMPARGGVEEAKVRLGGSKSELEDGWRELETATKLDHICNAVEAAIATPCLRNAGKVCVLAAGAGGGLSASAPTVRVWKQVKRKKTNEVVDHLVPGAKVPISGLLAEQASVQVKLGLPGRCHVGGGVVKATEQGRAKSGGRRRAEAGQGQVGQGQAGRCVKNASRNDSNPLPNPILSTPSEGRQVQQEREALRDSYS
jgi:hypothetical protein